MMRWILALMLAVGLVPAYALAQSPEPTPTPADETEPTPTPTQTPEEAEPTPTPVEGSETGATTEKKDEAAETEKKDEAKPPKPHHHAEPAPGIKLPMGLALHGRFDVSAERVGYIDNAMDGKASLRNYHHFLFLTRHAPSDPFGMSIELLDLTFYEASWRFKPASGPWRVVARAGKIIVPFGPEPPFHKLYGGRTGFDQQVMPIIWTRHGASGQFLYRLGTLALTDDLFVVSGHRLRNADDVLNLQNDFSTDDLSHIAVGNRIGAGWGPYTAWYSAYYNELGFGRRLLLQAVDITIHRPNIPVLDHFSLRLGAERHDVSGGREGIGGPGLDYYGFSDYLELRYYPFYWLYVQGRTGIRTTNNRRGTYVDDTRLDENDGETHSLGVVARYRGLTAGLYHYWNLEDGNEIPDDLLRLMVTYEF